MASGSLAQRWTNVAAAVNARSIIWSRASLIGGASRADPSLVARVGTARQYSPPGQIGGPPMCARMGNIGDRAKGGLIDRKTFQLGLVQMEQHVQLGLVHR